MSGGKTEGRAAGRLAFEAACISYLLRPLEALVAAPGAPLRDGTASSPGDRSAAAAGVDGLFASALLSLFERAARQPAASLVGAAVVGL